MKITIMQLKKTGYELLAVFLTFFLVSSFLFNFVGADNMGLYEYFIFEYDEYYSYDELTELLEQLQLDYPEIFKFESIGESYQGRDIWVAKVSDNVKINENEPEVMFSGGIHGHEKIGFQVTIYSLKAIVENYTYINVNETFTMRIRHIVNNTELFFIPMINPDGVVAGTRKNRMPNDCIFGDSYFCGVDLNRNFGYKWEEFNKRPLHYFLLGGRATVRYPFFDFSGMGKTGNGNYRGPSPFSEQETKAIKNFVENHDIITAIDYHCQGKKILYPWGWTRKTPEDKQTFLEIAEGISEINDFQVIQMSHWYAVVGFLNDWTYGEHNVLHFTIELGHPDKTPMLEECETHLLVNLYLAKKAMTLD